MATGYQLLLRVQQIDIEQLSGTIIEKNTDAVAELNRQQLHKGLNKDGLQLSPKYSEDSYFKSAEAAANYARWKKRLFPEMTYDVPNLIITGVYHRSISVRVAMQSVVFDASASFAGSIAGKYQNKALGLTDESKGTVWNDIVKHPLLQTVRDKTGFR